MENVILLVTLLMLGIAGHLFMRRSYDIGQWLRRALFDQAGEGDAGAGAGTIIPPDTLKFTPEQQKFINDVAAKERKTTESRFQDYEDLKRFKTEYEKQTDAQKQKELEEQKKYEEAKKSYETKINELSTRLSEKDKAIQDRDITFALTNEISKQNGFTEESIAMIKHRATIDANGKVVIKDKDANGVDVTLSVEAGVKKLFTERPHLVKAQGRSGAGTGAGTGGAGAGANGAGGGETLESLNAQLQEAMRGTDLKLRSEIKQKIRDLQAKKGISL